MRTGRCRATELACDVHQSSVRGRSTANMQPWFRCKRGLHDRAVGPDQDPGLIAGAGPALVLELGRAAIAGMGPAQGG
jgi:hypothetical protein